MEAAPTILRILHYASALALGFFIYPDWVDDSTILNLMRFVAFPVLTLTGVALWIGRRKVESEKERTAG